ncbi:MAG: hypothetical protein E6Q98_21995 [Rhodospirillaceae bacterium]|nr:MAG: hypothetical protein E6Q98_21995 [Rhodospirillaceae bacterium]
MSASVKSAQVPRSAHNADVIDRLLVGAVDLHCHSGPSVMKRSLDHIEAMRDASAAGLKAVLVKDHYYSAVPVTQMLNRHFSDLGVFMMGGIPLNNSTGGINPHAVDHGIKLGAKIVWMPTFHAHNHIAHQTKAKPGEEFPPKNTTSLAPEPVLFLDSARRPTDQLKLVLDLIAKHDLVLSAGHIHVSEIWPLFDEARVRGVKRLLVNHPSYLIDASHADIRQLAEMGAYLEHSLCMWFGGPGDKLYGPEELKALIEAGTIDRTILGSDLGQAWNCSPVDGFRQTIAMLIDLGYSEPEIRRLTSGNACALMGLE